MERLVRCERSSPARESPPLKRGTASPFAGPIVSLTTMFWTHTGRAAPPTRLLSRESTSPHPTWDGWSHSSCQSLYRMSSSPDRSDDVAAIEAAVSRIVHRLALLTEAGWRPVSGHREGTSRMFCPWCGTACPCSAERLRGECTLCGVTVEVSRRGADPVSSASVLGVPLVSLDDVEF